jgi:hypothetical protein
MIFSQKIFRLMHKIALFAILFASFAPTISHALVERGNINSFFQQVCSASGQKIFIEVVTSQGKQLQAGLDIKPGSQPVSINQHMDHCPFCHAGVADITIPSHSPTFELYLAQQVSQQRSIYQTPIVSGFIQTAHLTRAPPLL